MNRSTPAEIYEGIIKLAALAFFILSAFAVTG